MRKSSCLFEPPLCDLVFSYFVRSNVELMLLLFAYSVLLWLHENHANPNLILKTEITTLLVVLRLIFALQSASSPDVFFPEVYLHLAGDLMAGGSD
jgi:hypothetical protein